MRIALVSAANSVHTVRWANAFARRGHSVCVISCANHVAKIDSMPYDDAVEIKYLKFPTPHGYYLNAIELRQVLKKGHFDVVNVHYASGYGTLGRLAGAKHALLNVWGSDVYEFPYQSKFAERVVRKNLKYYDHLASTSICMAKQASNFTSKVFYITPFGVDLSKFKPIEGLKDGSAILFGTVKTLAPKYGISDTIMAFIDLHRRMLKEDSVVADRLKYEIYGDGPQKDELQKLIEDNGYSERIKLCGYVQNDKLPWVLNRFDIACYGSVSDSESFGVAAVEAMACGIPVIASDADGFKEVIEDGVSGIIVPKGDIGAIADAMYSLLAAPAERIRLGKNAIDRVGKLYDWDKNVDAMLRIYERVK